VALDGSKNSLRGLMKAMDIAKENHAKIIGLHIVQVPTSYLLSVSRTKIPQVMSNDIKKLLAEAKRKCKNSGIDFDSKVISGGDPGYDIVKYSQKSNVDTIVIGSRGLHPIKEAFLGSVANYVLHKSKIPVLIVK
jgi:nucleotide-binding universal stress UspA family protein